MNTTHIHLLLNHFPVIGTLIGSLLLLWGIIRKQNNIQSAAAILLALMALLAIPVFLTGEPAEESVEKIPGVSEQMIHLHEESAEIAIWLMGITGIVSVIALVLASKKHLLQKTAFATVFILSVICFGAMARTGYYGGQIRHSEITGAVAAGQQENGNIDPGKEVKAEKEKDDD